MKDNTDNEILLRDLPIISALILFGIQPIRACKRNNIVFFIFERSSKVEKLITNFLEHRLNGDLHSFSNIMKKTRNFIKDYAYTLEDVGNEDLENDKEKR